MGTWIVVTLGLYSFKVRKATILANSAYFRRLEGMDQQSFKYVQLPNLPGSYVGADFLLALSMPHPVFHPVCLEFDLFTVYYAHFLEVTPSILKSLIQTIRLPAHFPLLPQGAQAIWSSAHFPLDVIKTLLRRIEQIPSKIEFMITYIDRSGIAAGSTASRLPEFSEAQLYLSSLLAPLQGIGRDQYVEPGAFDAFLVTKEEFLSLDLSPTCARRIP